jgi:gamma-glutamylcyclotransferase (GGCT)/AIG2-like uncharacterized protein YtfP
MKRRFYLAYGSNLNIRQMRIRCSAAQPMGNTSLLGYQLLFAGIGGSAVATIAPKAGASVPAALWLISTEDEQALDRYEGFPHLYRKEMVKVRLGNRNLSAMVYVMNEGYDLGLPSTHYFHAILDGYEDFGLDVSALDAALKISHNATAPYKLSD